MSNGFFGLEREQGIAETGIQTTFIAQPGFEPLAAVDARDDIKLGAVAGR